MEMKNIKELGLTTIQLEDQVLLVKNGEIPENWYLDDANQIRESIIDDPDYWEGRLGYKSIIASTKPLKGLPLLVIKDGIKKLATKTLSEQDWDTSKGLPFNEGYLKGFKHGFKKARETFKYTEEDLRRAYNQGGRDMHDKCISHNWRGVYQSVDINEFSKIRQNFLQSLTKKELCVEVEGYKVNGMIDEATSYRPKITNNQIKAVWK